MAKNTAQNEVPKKGAHCDKEGWAKLSDEIDADAKQFRPMTVVDHLMANREYLVRNLAKDLSVAEIAGLLRERNILDVSDQTLRKFVKDNNLVPAKAQKPAKAPMADASKATPASSAKPPAAKAA